MLAQATAPSRRSRWREVRREEWRKSRGQTWGRLATGKKGANRALIFIDRWYGRWLEVGGSGLEWNKYPPAHGRRFTAPKILRRRIPSFHRREEQIGRASCRERV